jgi:Ca-activated chloride channel family protein
MQPKVLLDYEFAVSSNAYVVRALVKLEGRAPDAGGRLPLNLSVVLDRSGSMSGAKLAAARDAAVYVARRLYPEDLLSVVAYDDAVATVTEPATGAAQGDLAARILAIASGGSTNLSGGWMRGRELVARNARAGGSNRILLLTDGLANVGITSHEQLVGLCAEARRHGITTTTIGFGVDYDEHLLRAMADGGGGHTYYIERPDQAPGVFAEELEGLLTLAAQNVAVEVRPCAAARLTRIHHDFPRADSAGGFRLDLGDLYAREPKQLLLEFHVAEPSSDTPADIAEVRIDAHVLTAGGGVERQEVTLVLRTSLHRDGHVEPEVRRELLLQDAARAREAALEARRRGDFGGGHRVLERSAALLREQGDPADAAVHEEIDELSMLAAHFAAGRVTDADAKYMHQWAYDATHAKRMAMRRIARSSPRTPAAHAEPPIRYVHGDATRPIGTGLKIVGHLCTDGGAWEQRGFAQSVARRWPEPEPRYQAWARGELAGAADFRPGSIQLVAVEPQVWVANMIGKSVARPRVQFDLGFGRGAGEPRVRVDYAALERALAELAGEALRLGASVHMPRIGCGAAGGRWGRVEPMIVRHLAARGIPVTVYDL